MSDSGCQRWGGSGDTERRSGLGFHARSEGELESFTDDELLEYIRQARDAGRLDQFSFAMGMLANRRRNNLF